MQDFNKSLAMMQLLIDTGADCNPSRR